MGAGGQASGYEIDQSIRFNDDDSAYLSRTPGSAGNRKTWTLSWWLKRGVINARRQMFVVPVSGSTLFYIELDAGDGGNAGGDNKLIIQSETGSGTNLSWELEKGFSDIAGWYHFVVALDTTQSTANNRLKCYVNGVEQTDGWDRNTTPGQNEDQAWNTANEHQIGGRHHSSLSYFDGYMTEIHFIDGTAKEASDFGETDSSTGQWVPKNYSGSYGTNGFFIDGRDSSDLGDDESGNGNDFSSNGLTTADQMSDSPTNNHCTLNPLNKDTDCTLSDGNLQVGWTSGTDPIICGTMAVSSGKWYYEATFTGTFNFPGVGIAPAELSFGGSAFSSGTGTIFYYAPSGNYRGNGDNVSYGAEYFVGSKIGVALNLDDDEITFYKDNSSQGTLNLASIRSGYSTWVPLLTGGGSTENIIVNYGQSDFQYTPPTGFKAWNTSNLPDPAIVDPSGHFQPTVYTGNGTAIGSGGKAVTQVGSSTFQPDLVWIKCFTTGNEHDLYDAVRGTTKAVFSSASSAQATVTEGLTTFGSSGFTVGNRGEVNTNATDHVAWQWKANGSGSSNSDGNTTATVSANATSGFSIIKYEGTGSATTVGHGLGVVPKVMIVKDLENSRSWNVYHAGMGDAAKVMYLDQTVAAATDSAIFGSAPTSSVVNIVSGNGSNGSGIDYIMYAFVEVEGYSKFGSYEGNNSTDGPFVSLGFKPRLVMCKRYDDADGWTVLDTSRGSTNFGSAAGTGGDNPTAGNFMNTQLNWNSNGANEDNATGSRKASFTSNGFKVRNTNTAMNASGGDYVYMAFAESPFKTATAR